MKPGGSPGGRSGNNLPPEAADHYPHMPAPNVGLSGGGGDAERRVVRVAAGDRTSGLTWPMNRLVRALPTRLRRGSGGGARRSGALFGARAGAFDRRLERGRRHPQHRLPRAVLYALQSGRAASGLAIVVAPRTKPWGYTFPAKTTRPVTGSTARSVVVSRKVRRRVLLIFLGTLGPGRGEEVGHHGK